MALASPRAKVDKRYSPVWEGILNLRRPEAGEDAKAYRAECSAVVTNWYKRYEATTGHKVLRVDVHLDEGHMVEGEAVLNAHAHVIADRTNDLGRVIKLSPKQLRELQTMTAEITQLERGKSSFETGRKHISHHAYKHLAEQGRLETQQVKAELETQKGKTAHIQKLFLGDTPIISGLKKEVSDLREALTKTKSESEQLKAQYALDRAALKASGEATQQAYQALKAAHEGALAELKKSNSKVEKMEKQITQLTDENAKLAADKARFAAMAESYQEQKAAGSPAHLIEPMPKPAKTTQEPPKRPEAPTPSPAPTKSLRGAFLEVFGALEKVELHMIDGARLDAAEGRLGVFSWPNRVTGKRNEVLCDVPSNKVMPAIGEVFNSRAAPGKGVGR
jgi:uncharacterized phage infection (PIP) family protein YhgE